MSVGDLVGDSSPGRLADPAWPAVDAGDTRCPFCFPAAIAPYQLLLTTANFYLLAPAGQIVEGFLSILTHTCRDQPARLRCLDDITPDAADELSVLRDLVSRFYRDEYQANDVFYEHGRGGGHTSSLPSRDFLFHPHLCALPGDLVVHESLEACFSSCPAPSFRAIRSEIGRRPYLYVHTPGAEARRDPVVYFGGDLDSDDRIGSLSLKKLLVQANSLRTDADWRRYPGRDELVDLVEKFNRWYATVFRRSTDPRWETIFTGSGGERA